MDCWREGKDGMQNLINGLCSSCGGILGCRYDHSKKVPSLIHFPLDVAVNRLEVKTCWSRIWMLLVLKPPVCISGQLLQWYNLIWYMISWMAGHLIWLCHLDWVGYRFHCYIHLGLTLVVSAPRTPQLFLWSFKLLALVQLPHFLSSPKLLLFLPQEMLSFLWDCHPVPGAQQPISLLQLTLWSISWKNCHQIHLLGVSADGLL